MRQGGVCLRDLPVWATGEASPLLSLFHDSELLLLQAHPPLFSGDSVTRGDALARTVMQLLHPTLASGEGHIHYSLLRRHAFPICTAMGDIRSHNRPR